MESNILRRRKINFCAKSDHNKIAKSQKMNNFQYICYQASRRQSSGMCLLTRTVFNTKRDRKKHINPQIRKSDCENGEKQKNIIIINNNNKLIKQKKNTQKPTPVKA